MPKGILEITMSLSDIIFLFIFFFVGECYLYACYQQPAPGAHIQNFQASNTFYQVPHLLYGFEISWCDVNSIASKCYLADLAETGRIQTKYTPYINNFLVTVCYQDEWTRPLKN